MLVILCSCYFSACTVAMLSWLVDEVIVEATIKSLGKRLIEEDVETRPERVPNVILDENVDIYVIRKYFSNDVWLVVTEVVHQKQRNFVYVCKSCYHDLHKQASIICDHCLSGITYSALV